MGQKTEKSLKSRLVIIFGLKNWISIPSTILLVHIWKDAVFHALSSNFKRILRGNHPDILIGQKYRNFLEKKVIFHIFQLRNNTLGHYLYLKFLLCGSVSNRSNQNTLFETKKVFLKSAKCRYKVFNLIFYILSRFIK